MASVLVRDAVAGATVVTKGAPEVVLDRCVDVTDAVRAALDALFADGERVVAVASRPVGAATALSAADEAGLTFEGFLTFADRPKADAGAVSGRARAPRRRGQDHHRRQRPGRGQGLPRHRARGHRAC